jgi:hypothetical protein
LGARRIDDQGRFDELTASLRHAKLFPQQNLSSGCAQADQHFRLYHRELGIRLGMNAAFAARLLFEMFDHVGDVSQAAIDSGLRERLIKQLTGGTHKRLAGEIFIVARLLANKHYAGFSRSLAEHRLGASLP